MKGDFSRDTFKPARHYSAVRLQQGRVVTDADWNEQADINRYRAERLGADVVGPCGVPEGAAGFELQAATHAMGVFALMDDAWVVGEDGAIVRTTDGGATWTIHDAGTTAHLRAVHFVDPATGWAVGDRGTILKTTDGGVTWTLQDAGVSIGLRSVFALDGSRAWVAGDAGTVFRTLDGGVTWLPAAAGTGRLYAVRFADAARGWVAGQDGHIATTPDGGVTWTPQAAGTAAHLRALHFASATSGWAVGDSGTILKTTDGGFSWTPQVTGVARHLRSVAFVGPNDGWAVGDKGVAVRTTNGGTTWFQEDLGTEATLRGVALAAAQQGFAVGDGSVAVRIGAVSPGAALEPLPGASLSIAPGRMYVGGVLCELEERVSFYAQPHLPSPARLMPGTHLVFVEAWLRQISMLEDPTIREVALGGPDTATRTQTVWQVKALSLAAASPPPHCLSDLPEWRALVERVPARLRARAEPQQVVTGVCEIAAAAGYRRLENQLYRVEVHSGAPLPTFKWSRENGSVAYAIVAVTEDPVKNETVVRLSSRGLDENLDLAAGDWVEILDDDVVLGEGAGPILEYLRDGDDPLEIVLKGLVLGLTGRDPARHPILRRWEQKPPAPTAGTLPIEEGKWIDLEEGVQVWFEAGGDYRPGDFWWIPARTITGDVEWGRDEHGHPEAKPPAGIERLYCRLCLVEVAGNGAVLVASDCRNVFPPLTAFTQLLYLSGDGQDGIPGLELPQRLRVRVVKGERPVAGAHVRFAIETGAGTLAGVPTGVPLEVTTASDGVAEARWVLDADPHPSKSHQRVRATLLDAGGGEVEGQLVVFCATATVTLQFAGGDGQDGTAGQLLDHPLDVRVSNGQRAVAGARVRFEVTSGGGAIVGANPATTDLAGAASVQWQLGAAGLQRVRAELLDAAAAPIQSVAFNASFRPQVAARGCAVTVGAEGEVKVLTREIFEELLQRFEGNLCLCLLPGLHEIDDLEIVRPAGRLSIHGCGRATTILLRRRIAFGGFEYIQVGHLEARARENGGFTFLRSTEVDITSITARADASPERPLLEFQTVRNVTVSESRLATKLPGAAVVIQDGEAVVRLIHDDIAGAVSFYGPPGPPPSAGLIRALISHFVNLPAVPFTGRGWLAIRDCALERLTIGGEMIRRLEELASGTIGSLDGLFRAAAIDGCTILLPEAALVAATLTLTSCSFLARQEVGPYGTFVSDAATAVGNLAAQVSDRLPLHILTNKGQFRLADANLAFVNHL